MLWLPQRLLKTSGTVELNYLAAHGRDRLYLAFANQSPESVTTEVTLNAAVLPSIAGKSYPVNGLVGTSGTTMRDGKLSITVAPMGMTAIEIGGLAVAPKFQDSLVGAKATDAWRHDYLELPWGGTRAMVLNFGPAASTAFIYLRDDDSKFRDVTLTYNLRGEEKTVVDAAFPFEFTVPLPRDATTLRFRLKGTTLTGETTQSDWGALEK